MLNALTPPTLQNADFGDPNRTAWFEDFVHRIKSDKLMLDTGTADTNTIKLYEAAITNDVTGLINSVKIYEANHYIPRIIGIFVQNLSELISDPNSNLLKLAFGIDGYDVLVWAEMADDAEYVWDQIIIAAAKANAEYYPSGFTIETTVFEASDNISFPKNFTLYKS